MSPHRFQESRAGNGLAGGLNEAAKEREFSARETKIHLSTKGSVLDGVEREGIDRKGGLRGLPRPAKTGNPGEQFTKRERLDKIVVRASVESGDHMGLGIACCEHQNRGRVAAVA